MMVSVGVSHQMVIASPDLVGEVMTFGKVLGYFEYLVCAPCRVSRELLGRIVKSMIVV
jgi:hypothetical protein